MAVHKGLTDRSFDERVSARQVLLVQPSQAEHGVIRAEGSGKLKFALR
jgi:hypothetical protein